MKFVDDDYDDDDDDDTFCKVWHEKSLINFTHPALNFIRPGGKVRNLSASFDYDRL